MGHEIPLLCGGRKFLQFVVAPVCMADIQNRIAAARSEAQALEQELKDSIAANREKQCLFTTV